jgi:hypothetical protein
MRKFIAAAAFLAAQWQPAHAQAILGSIPEEFLGDWCSQEKTNGEEIFRPGACKLAWFLEHRSHDPRHGPPILRFRKWDGERRQPSRCGCTPPIPRKSNRRCTVPSSSYSLARRSNSSWSRWTKKTPWQAERKVHSVWNAGHSNNARYDGGCKQLRHPNEQLQSLEHIPVGDARSHAAKSLRNSALYPLYIPKYRSRCSNAQWNMTMRRF